MFEEIFKRRKLNVKKLCEYGFKDHHGIYRYTIDIMDGQFELTILIDSSGAVDTSLVEHENGEEYILYKTNAAGTFVGAVKLAVQDVLSCIAEQCFDFSVFKTQQAEAIIDYVRNKYDDELEFLWKKFPDNAVWRRKDNKKWYGAILTVSGDRLGFDSSEIVEIIDLRLQPELIEPLLEKEHFYPGWHMNKKHWYTICLDGSVAVEEICERIDNSYQIAGKK